MLWLDTENNSFKSVREKVKAYFQSQRWKDVLLFLTFMLIAAVFWYLQNLQQEYEIEISIPVRYKNVPAGISFTGTAPEKITAQVKDKGSMLLNYSFGRTFAPVEVNMKEVSDREEDSITVGHKDIEADISRQLLASTVLIDFNPQRIELKYNKKKEKTLPVVFNGRIDFVPGFQQSGELTIRPATVKVYGTLSALDSLYEVKTVSSEIKKANKTVIRTLSLQKTEGISFQPEAVTVTIPVEEFTDKTLEIPVSLTGVPPEYTVRLFPPAVKVVCSVPLSRFKELTEDAFSIELPFSGLEQDISGVTPVNLTGKPDWIRSASLTPDKIEFILEQHRDME
jgi:YbbR domain-containing protein